MASEVWNTVTLHQHVQHKEGCASDSVDNFFDCFVSAVGLGLTSLLTSHMSLNSSFKLRIRLSGVDKKRFSKQGTLAVTVKAYLEISQAYQLTASRSGAFLPQRSIVAQVFLYGCLRERVFADFPGK